MSDTTSDTGPTSADHPAATSDALSSIDDITTSWGDEERRSAEEHKDEATKHSTFESEFTQRFEDDIRPAMQAIIDRLRRDGGGGTILERPADAGRLYSHRFTLWMSLSGEIDGPPRQDRYPYLQLDADVETGTVVVSEGDMWRGRAAGSSAKVADWTFEEMDAAHVDKEAIAILRRSAS